MDDVERRKMLQLNEARFDKNMADLLGSMGSVQSEVHNKPHSENRGISPKMKHNNQATNSQESDAII